MTDPMDFPVNPFVGQLYTAPSNVVYVWDGFGWTIGFYDTGTQQLLTVGDLLRQVRTLLQDTDTSSGQYRYSTDSIMMALNQGMADMYRIRPDLFITVGFTIPIYTFSALEKSIDVEPQFIPALVYYVVGLVQLRDDEQTQDARAMGFVKAFHASLLTVN